MVDIHCHILPEVDDGAKTWDVAAAMCRMAKADGIAHVVASPHANHEFEYRREKHLETLERLRAITGGILQLSLGCDFHFSYENIQDALQHPERYCIGATRYLLVEFSDFSLSPATGEHLQHLMDAGMTPIITHPERNPILQRNPRVVLDWVDNGALVQVTANSLTGRWGATARKTAEWLVKERAVHVLATDAHDSRSRPPVLSAGRDEMAKLAGPAVAQAMVFDNPQAIVDGKPLPPMPHLK